MSTIQVFSRDKTFANVDSSKSFRDTLIGENAFYKHSNYEAITKKEMAQKTALSSSYVYNTEYKITTIVKQILSFILFPILIHKRIHSLLGKFAFLPAASYEKNYANVRREAIDLKSEWKYKRITIETDGYKIDAVILGKQNIFNNNRWLVASNGNAEFYEDKLFDEKGFKKILSEINSNGIVFNYPGVGASTGLPNRYAMAKAYRAILTFLEDEKKGLGAKQIIGYGHSIGAGTQGEALSIHKLKKGIKYVFVKSRTFDSMSKLVSILTNSKSLGFLAKLFGWNMSSVKSSKKLLTPEIILQTANVRNYEIMQSKDSHKIKDDGIIHQDASLAKTLLQDPKCPKDNKIFIGIPQMHNEPLENYSFLAQKIKQMLE